MGVRDIGAGHDTNNHDVSAIWVGSVGNVSVVCPNGSTGIFLAVPSGTLIELAIKRVNATNTTASSIMGLC